MTVVLRGSRRSPEIVVRYELQLSDPWVRESAHPYHVEFRDAGAEGTRARILGCEAAQKAAQRATYTLLAVEAALAGRGVAVMTLASERRGARPKSTRPSLRGSHCLRLRPGAAHPASDSRPSRIASSALPVDPTAGMGVPDEMHVGPLKSKPSSHLQA